MYILYTLNTNIYIYIYVYVYIHIYIYIHVYMSCGTCPTGAAAGRSGLSLVRSARAQ